MSEERAVYGVLNSTQNRDKVDAQAHSGFVRVLDPKTGRFLFEFHPRRNLIAWTDRGRRIEIDLTLITK